MMGIALPFFKRRKTWQKRGNLLFYLGFVPDLYKYLCCYMVSILMGSYLLVSRASPPRYVTGDFSIYIYICDWHCIFCVGITCPRATRDDSNPGDAFGQEALMFTKELIMQREVCRLLCCIVIYIHTHCFQ